VFIIVVDERSIKVHTRRRLSLLMVITLLLLTITAQRSSAVAQSSNSDWQPFSPEGEEFTIVMPKDPKFEESQEPYHRDMTLNTRLYLSSSSNRGPVLAIVSLSGIKAGGAGYNDFLRLNSYVDAFKNWFPQKVRGKDAVAKLTLVGEKTLNGNLGREYRLVIGDLSGTARVFATRRRFYAAVVLNTKKDDELADLFLSSFVLPEKTAPTVVVTGNPPVAELVDRKPGSNPGPNKENADTAQKADPGEVSADSKADDKAGDSAATANTKSGEKAPISGGVLNGKAIVMPQPDYPPIAAQAKASGTVTVQVLVDETGNVVSAHAVSGHPLLQAAAVAAARQAKFSPTSLMGEPVKVTGVLSYTFPPR
jgi:TonB family protein